MQFGISVILNLVNGTLSGIRMADVTGWAGHALAGPRDNLDELLQQEGADRTGVYILAGIDASSGNLCVYVGKSRAVSTRIRRHQAEGIKKFWTETYLFTDMDLSFNEALAGYVESVLVEKLERARRVQIKNSNSPDKPLLARADVNRAEHFLSNLKVALPVLGLDILEKKAWPKEITQPPPPDLWVFQGARARIRGKETTVLKGSQVRKWFGKGKSRFDELQGQLEEEGALRWTSETHGTLTRDVDFTSTSAAASFVCGRSASGPASWKKLGANEPTLPVSDPVPDPEAEAAVFELKIAKIGIAARAHLAEDGNRMVVVKGSVVRGKWAGKDQQGSNAKQIKQLCEEGTIVVGPNGLGKLTQDVTASSPSHAASIVSGTTRNGKVDWKHEQTGETLRDWLKRTESEG